MPILPGIIKAENAGIEKKQLVVLTTDQAQAYLDGNLTVDALIKNAVINAKDELSKGAVIAGRSQTFVIEVVANIPVIGP